MSAADPLMLCYDGSKDAKHAIAEAGSLFPGAHALVLTIWQPVWSLSGLGWAGETAGADLAELDRAAAEERHRTVAEGVALAQEAGLEAEPLAVQADGPIWEAIIEAAERKRASIVVMGSRGRTGLRSMLLGSVSNSVVQHARRPTLVIHRSGVTSARRDRALERSA